MFKIIIINSLWIKNITCLLLLLFLFVRPVYAVQIKFTVTPAKVLQGDKFTLILEFIEEKEKDKNCHLFAYHYSDKKNDKNHPIFFEDHISSGHLRFEGVSGSWLYIASANEGSLKSTMTFSVVGNKELDLTAKIKTYNGEEFGLPNLYRSTERCKVSFISSPAIISINKRSKKETPVLSEPEKIQKSTCDALEQPLNIPKDLTVTEKDQFIIERLSSERDKSFYISQCKDRGSDLANQIRDRNFEPEETSTQSSHILRSAQKQLGNIRSRLDKLRTTKGERGFDVSGATLNIQGETLSGNLLGGGAGDGDGLLENSRWGVFTNGEYGFGGQQGMSDLSVGSGDRNFNFNSQGLTVGADYRFPGEKIMTGGAVGYKNFDTVFTTQEGGTNTKGVNFSAYGTYLISEKSYLDVVVGYGEDQIDSRRPVNNDGSGQIGQKTTFAFGKPKANALTLSAGGGYEFNQRAWSLTPYGRIDYTKANIEGYDETPSHSSAKTSLFKINTQNAESLLSTLGLKTSRVISTSKGVFIPYALLEWKHEFKEETSISGELIDKNALKDFSFEESNRSKLNKDHLNVGIGVSAVLPEGRSTFLTLESRLGDAVIKDKVIRAGFRWEF
jgi:uncharacterized protein YhjY with autotransporter beta-barrel domain